MAAAAAAPEAAGAAASTVFDRLIAQLQSHGVPFRLVQHEATLTSALLLKCDGTFRLFVLAANRKLNSKRFKQATKAKDVRFGTREELQDLTGLVPGSVPPFGDPVLPGLPAPFADRSTGAEFGRVAFNAGDLCRSVVMAAGDWTHVAQPQWLDDCTDIAE